MDEVINGPIPNASIETLPKAPPRVSVDAIFASVPSAYPVITLLVIFAAEVVSLP